MKKILHKLLLLVTLAIVTTPVHSLSEENAKLAALAGGVIAGGATAYCVDNLKGDHAMTACTAVAIGGLSWWLLEQYLYTLTPESQYRPVVNIIYPIQADPLIKQDFKSLEAFTSYVKKEFTNFSKAKDYLEEISKKLSTAQALIETILKQKLEITSELFKKYKKLEVEIKNISAKLHIRMCYIDYLLTEQFVHTIAIAPIVTQDVESIVKIDPKLSSNGLDVLGFNKLIREHKLSTLSKVKNCFNALISLLKLNQLLIKPILIEKLISDNDLYAKSKKIEEEINNITSNLQIKMYHIDYLTLEESVQKVEESLIATENLKSNNILESYAKLTFGTSWPLVLAKNYCCLLFETLAQDHSHLQSIILKISKNNESGKASVSKKCELLAEKIKSLLEILKQNTQHIIEHDDYSFQVTLHEKHMQEKLEDERQKLQEKLQREQLQHQAKLQHEQHEFQQNLRDEQRQYLDRIQLENDNRTLNQNRYY